MLGGGEALRDARRAAVALREEVTRGDAAERAVAPLAMEEAVGVGDDEAGKRRAGGVGRRGGLVVAMAVGRQGAW